MPGGCRVRYDVAVHRPVRSVMNEREDIEQPRSRDHRREEVTGTDRLGVGSQECGPALIAAPPAG
jgi:hypothetical protein